MTLGRMIQVFFAEIVGEVKESTLTTYGYVLESMSQNLGKGTHIEDVSRGDLVEWRAKITESHATSSVNTYIRICRRFWNWVVDYMDDEKDIAFRNPSRRLRLLKESNIEVKAIAHEDVFRLAAEAYRDGNLRNQALVLFLYSTGGRVSGVTDLLMENLELEEERAWVIEKGENGRYVYLPDITINAVSNYIEWQRPKIDSPYVFLSNRRDKMSRQAIWYVMRTLAERAKIDGPHNPHSFRHAFSKAYLKNGGDLSSLSRLLGHSTITVTHQFYSRWANNELKDMHSEKNPLANLKNFQK